MIEEVSRNEMLSTIHYMTEHFPYRLAGSPCEAAASRYVTERLKQYGLEVENKEFYTYNSDPMYSKVTVLEPEMEIDSLPCAHIRATKPEGEIFELIYVGNGDYAAYKDIDVTGKMVLVEVSYAPPVPEKARIAYEMGAAGIMCMNWGNDEEVICRRGLKGVWGNPTEANFHCIPEIVGVGVTRGAGLKLKQLCLEGRKVEVTTSAILGARYEYGMIWMVILALFMRGIYMRSAYTAQVVLGMPILDCINKFYGKALCAIAGFVCAFGCVAYEVGNFSGSGISINLLFGLDWKIGGVIMSLVCLLFIFGRSIYNRVEKGMKICVFLMVAGFLIALIAAGGPSLSGVAKGLVPSLPDKNALFTTLAFIGSCAAISGVVYGTHLSKEKKWDTEDIKNGTLMWDVILGAGSIALIVLLVLLTSAKILYPQGITVSEVNDLTMLFKTIVGAAAPYLLGICLLAASASSLLVSAQMGATLLLAGFGREAKMEDKDVQWLSVIILALGALTAFIFGSSSPTQVLLIANICAVINAPLLAILIIMIVNRKEMGEFKSSKINNILLSLCCAGLLAVTVYNLCKLLHIV